MGREVWIGLIISAALIGGFFAWRAGFFAPQPPVPTPSSTPPPAPVEAPAHYPAPPPAEPAAELPPLADSDPVLQPALEELFGKAATDRYLVPKNLVGKIVATVDSLDRDPVPLRLRPVAPIAGLPQVDVAGETLVLSERNAVRYRLLIRALQAVDGAAIANLYLRYYPLFQEAYVELGYPHAYFNDRVIQVIDHLLAAPDLKGPLPLARPKVLYQFADPELERRSSGQKALIRLGPDHAAVVKAKLREIRAVIATQRADAA